MNYIGNTLALLLVLSVLVVVHEFVAPYALRKASRARERSDSVAFSERPMVDAISRTDI